MATLEQLSVALKNADAAGDADAARMLAAEITKMQSAPVAKGSLLPISRGASGKVSFDSDAGIVGSVKRAFMLPGDVMQGKASADDTGRVLELATMGTPINPAIRAGDAAIPGVAASLGTKKPVVPTTKELYEAGAKDLNAVRDSGLELTGNAVADFARRAQQKLYDDRGWGPHDAPATFAKLKELENAPPGSIATAKNLKSIRESFGATAQSFNPQAAKDQAAAARVINDLDGFIQAPDAKAVLAGDPAATGALWKRGNANISAGYRSNEITGELDRATTGILERADGRAQAANSGRNGDNTIRSKIASFLEKPKEVSSLTDEEIAALAHVREGGLGRNTARQISNWLGAGGGLGQSAMVAGGATAGAAAGGPIGAALGGAAPFAVGAGARSIANHLARKDLKGVDELLRKRSPLYEERVANPETFVISPEKRAALIKLLMQSQAAEQ
jgi:hypothetical protein